MRHSAFLRSGFFLSAALAAFAALAGGCQLLAGLGGEQPLGSGTGGTGGSGGTGSTTDTGGSGGTGLTGPCSPDQTETCYSGAKGTQGVGACKAGKTTCSPEGMWGACEGEMIPQAESCSLDGDEDCNAIDCTVWMKTLIGEVYANGVDVDAQGNVYAAVSFYAGIDFGDGAPVVPIGNGDIALLKYDRAGELVWKKPFQAAGDQTIRGLSVDAAGNIAIGGDTSGAIDFGTGKIDPGAFVAKLDTDGKALWARSGFGSQSPAVSSVEIDSKGNVLAGGSASTIDFGTGLLTGGDTLNFFVAKFAAATGEPQWVKITKGGATEYLSGIAVDSSDSLVVAGSWNGMYLGLAGQEAPPNDLYNCCNQQAPFLLRLDPDGALSDYKMLAGYQNNLNATIKSIGVDAFGVATMVGDFSGKVDFSSGTYDAAGSTSAFVLHDQASGFNQWSKAFVQPDAQTGADFVGIDGKGNIALSGTYNGPADFGGGPLPVGMPSAFVLKLDKDGNFLWNRSYTFGDGNIQGMASGTLENETVLTGTFYGNVDFGTGVVAAQQGMFLVKLGQ
jgi:hypothetical protein